MQRYRADYQGMAAVSRSFRFPAPAWERLCQDAQAAGLDRTTYLTGLIEAGNGNGELALLRAENRALKVMMGADPDAVVLHYAPAPEAEPGTANEIHEPGTTDVPTACTTTVSTP